MDKKPTKAGATKPKKRIKFKVVEPKTKPKPKIEEKKKKIKFVVKKKEEPKPAPKKKKIKFVVKNPTDKKLDDLKKKVAEQSKKDGIKRRVLPTGEVQRIKPKPSELRRFTGVSKEQANKMDTAELFGKLPSELRLKILNPKETGVKVAKDELQLSIFDGETYKEFIDDFNSWKDFHYSNIFRIIFKPTFTDPNRFLPSYNKDLYYEDSVEYDEQEDDEIENNLMDIAHSMKFYLKTYSSFLKELKKQQPEYFSYFIQYYSFEATKEMVKAKYLNKPIKLIGSKKDIFENFRDEKLEIIYLYAGDTGNMLVGKKPNLVGFVEIGLASKKKGIYGYMIGIGKVDIKKIKEEKDGSFSVNINNIDRTNDNYLYWKRIGDDTYSL